MSATTSGKKIVISLGGSLISPRELDHSFLKSFRDMVMMYVDRGYSFLIVTGGGSLARTYIQHAQQLGMITSDDADHIGILATHIHAELLRILFPASVCASRIIKDPDDSVLYDHAYPIMIGGGWKPGASSDHATVRYAHALGASTIINMSNIEYIYEKDPSQFPDAHHFTELSWPAYRALIPETWTPGLSAPFDPLAAAFAESQKLTVAIMGSNMENIIHYIDTGECHGTLIT